MMMTVMKEVHFWFTDILNASQNNAQFFFYTIKMFDNKTLLNDLQYTLEGQKSLFDQ